jgi:hypothetical protein
LSARSSVVKLCNLAISRPSSGCMTHKEKAPPHGFAGLLR